MKYVLRSNVALAKDDVPSKRIKYIKDTICLRYYTEYNFGTINKRIPMKAKWSAK